MTNYIAHYVASVALHIICIFKYPFYALLGNSIANSSFRIDHTFSNKFFYIFRYSLWCHAYFLSNFFLSDIWLMCCNLNKYLKFSDATLAVKKIYHSASTSSSASFNLCPITDNLSDLLATARMYKGLLLSALVRLLIELFP